MPYCLFLHAMTGLLNACLIDLIRTVNKETRYGGEDLPYSIIPEECYIPASIAEYFRMISNTVITQSDLVCINIPLIGIQNHSISAIEEMEAQDAGGFGPCNADTHNVYECYASPLVTSRLVEATRLQNETRAFVPWDPLLPQMAPENGLANRNLIGYRPIETLTPEGLRTL